MRVEKIYLNGFRNYDGEIFEFSPGINIISGRNAQGKTNLIEGVYMLTGGRSFRSRFDRELIGFDSDWAEILADIYANEREQTIKIVLRRSQKKQILQNGVKKTGTELSESLRAVLFCPDDLGIVKDGAAARRRLLDIAICQLRPGYAKLLTDFNKLYENKLRILRDYREKPSMLSALDDFSQGLCRTTARLIRYRASFSRRMTEEAARIHAEFSGNLEQLDIRYKTVSTVTDPMAGFDEVLRQVYEHQATHRQAELDSGSCLTGAHKDDLEIFINGNPARSFASQGQTRTAALSIKLAERELHLAETGEYPVLLLDDVLSELDSRRQDFVLNKITEGQTLITCCEDSRIAERTGGRVLMIEKGRVTCI